MENLKSILEQIEREKGIPSEELISMIESASTSAFKKHGVSQGLNYNASIDRESGKLKVFVEKNVVKKVADAEREIDKISALTIDSSVQLGDKIQVEISADKFARIAAQTAKQIIIQKMRENERENVYNEYKAKEGELLTGIVYRSTGKTYIIEIGKAEAILPEREQIKSQKLTRGDSVKLYIVEVSKGTRGSKILVSRTHPGFVAELFKLEVPEIADGVVEIMKIVRDPGIRCKVAVLSHNPRVDPIGACVGINGVRVQSVINELGGERMDLIKYSDDIKEYLANSLSPAKVEEIAIVDETKKEARIVVSDEMLSLAIGKSGQNVRLAARLTNWHMDIQSGSQQRDNQKTQALRENIVEIKNLPGVGEKIVGLLIKNGINSIQKIRESGLDSIIAIPGIGKKTALKIIESIKRKNDK